MTQNAKIYRYSSFFRTMKPHVTCDALTAQNLVAERSPELNVTNVTNGSSGESTFVTNVAATAATKATYDLGTFGGYETFDPSDGYQLCWGPYVPLGRFNVRGPYAFFLSA
jgi:hypothetical protein